MVEFALVLPVLLLLVMGIIQFGIVFNNWIQVTSAAREGARKAAVSRTAADPRAAAIAAAKASAPGLDASKLVVTPSATPWAQGSDVTVTVTYPWSVSILGFVVHSGNLSATTSMRVE
jgi:Flp pilus assembly protein TadG